jgi:hypothetical protein
MLRSPLQDASLTDTQSDTTLSEYRKTAKTTMALSPHTSMGEFLMMYEGLILYVKEMDEDRYQQLCSVSIPVGASESD